jgi:hypothetical protein
MEPLPAVPTVLNSLRKRVVGADGRFSIEDLDASDHAFLHHIWQGRPHYCTATPEAFADYKDAFASAVDKPDWELQTDFRNLRGEAQVRRMNVENHHFWQMDAWARRGDLFLLTSDRRQSFGMGPTVLISVKDAAKYLESIFFQLVEVDAVDEAEEARDHSTPGPADWQVKARKIADTIAQQKHLATGIRDISGRSIMESVAEELGKDESTWGTRGPRGAESVRKHALNGWKFSPSGGANGANGAEQ